MIKDYYYLLGLPRGACLNDIKKAYRQLAAQYHPDKVASMTPEAQQEATAKMTELNEAMSILSDPDRRAEYDRIVELIPERKPKPQRKRPSPTTATAKSTTAAEVQEYGAGQASSENATEETPANRSAPRREPSTVTARTGPPSVEEPTAPSSGMLAEEFARKRRAALRKLPLRWKELGLRGWQWALEGKNWHRSIVVAHKHMETLSLLSFRSFQISLEGLIEQRRLALRPTTIIALVSYERLMDAQSVQKNLHSLVSSERGVWKNVRTLLIIYDGKRASLVGVPSKTLEIQQVIQVLMGR